MTQGSTTKICKTCCVELPLHDYHKRKQSSDGYGYTCKKCVSGILKNYYENNRDVRLKLAKEYRAKSGYKEKQSTYHKKYRNRREYPKQQKNAQEQYKIGNELKLKARYILNNAITQGKIKRPNRCSLCNENISVEGHHCDYTKPLDVIWLCKSCHGIEHTDD